MTNVLEICESYEGGVKTHLNKLHEYTLKDEDIQSFFWVSSKRTSNEIPSEFMINDNLSTLVNPVKQYRNLIKLKRFVKENDITVLHAHSTFAAILVYLFKLFIKRSIITIYTPHAYFSEKSMSKIKLFIIINIERIITRSFSKVIHVSNDEEKHAIDNRIVNKKNSVVIYNGIERNLISEYPIEANANIILNVARMNDQKNPEAFIKFAEYCLMNSKLNLEFVYIGDGPLLEECQRLVDSKGLDNKIKFLGYKNNVRDYLIKSRMYFSTARYEGLPYSVLEAMSVGLPLILSDVVGHKELINHNGFLINSEKDVLKAIESILKDSDNTIGKNSIELCLNKYVNEVNYHRILELYKGVII